MQVEFSLDALERHGLEGGDVVRKLESANKSLAAGTLKRGEESWPLRVVNQFASLEEIGALPVDRKGLRLRDVAAIRYREPDLDYGRHLGQNPAAAAIVVAETVRDEDGRAAGLRIASRLDAGQKVHRQKGAYLLRTNCEETDPALLWKWYIQLTQAEAAFRTAKDAAGNSAIATTFKVNVVYKWTGFFSPINNSALNSVKT